MFVGCGWIACWRIPIQGGHPTLSAQPRIVAWAFHFSEAPGLQLRCAGRRLPPRALLHHG